MKSRAECIKEYGSDYFIRQKVDSGELFKVDKGIYSEEKHVPELAVLSFKYPQAVMNYPQPTVSDGVSVMPPGGMNLQELYILQNRACPQCPYPIG